MGVYGSGPYGFAGSKVGKATTSQCLRLDVRKLKRDGALLPGRNITWTWTRSNGNQSSIGINMITEDELLLHYTCRVDGKVTPVETRIRIDYTGCNYGNKRPWFRCSKCHTRVATLFQKGIYFNCRKCQDLTYYTCQEAGNLNDMATRRVNRILTRLKSNEKCGFDIVYHTPKRPRYMHSNTYEKLLIQYRNVQREYAASVRAKLQSFGCDVKSVIDLPDWP